ncbi:MAG: radical SAM protein [Candidatus Aminicenantales bacterium]
MGCIGFPAHPVWEITLACNLNCIHCHASSGKPHPDELTTEEGLKLVDEIASIKEFCMLVLTGGEPLVRKDIFKLMDYGKKRGLKFVIATNGHLITEEVAFCLKESGGKGVAVSLDSSLPEVHNFIRNNPQAYELALRGIKNAKKAGLAIQINFTATKHNLSQLGDTIDMVNDLGADIMLVYQLLCVGRGEEVGDYALGKEENQRLLSAILEKQKSSSVIIEPVASPQYWPYLLNGENSLKLKLAKTFFHGCTAGRGLVYIKANGDVWPCPFIEVSAGNVKNNALTTIWQEAEVFQRLRKRGNLKGRCGDCELNEICGGCRGKNLTRDYLDEDTSCFIRNRD